MHSLTRRQVLAATLTTVATPLVAQSRNFIDVWRDPNCGCCSGWIDHLRASGFEVADHPVASVGPYRTWLGTPSDLLSCHAGLIRGLALEGHVPAYAINRALTERPSGVVGLAVPAMPSGTPGMDGPGAPVEEYDLFVWFRDGSHAPWMRMRGGMPI